MKNLKTSKNTKYKTEWDFSDIYKSISDPRIEEDCKMIEKVYWKFAKKYKDKSDYLETSEGLAKALEDWENLNRTAGTWKPGWYLSMLLEKDSNNDTMRAMLNKMENRLTMAANQIIFFEIALGKIDKDKQKEFLTNKTLGGYKYFLERIFITAKYNLTEAEEKIINLKRQPAYNMWTDVSGKLQDQQQIVWKGKKLPMGKAIGMINELNKSDRYKLRDLISQKLKSISFIAEAELNAVVTNKKIDDDLRNVSKPYELTVVGYQNDLNSIETLVNTITDKFYISHKFYKLKAKLLKLKKLRIADTSISIGKTKMKIPFNKAVDLAAESFASADVKFSNILLSMAESGRIDVYPMKGKRTGAFCNNGHDIPTIILLNHTDNLNSYTTLAHEMGHAIHSELSRSQPVLYENYTISVAEVASTFFENIAFEKVFEMMSEKEKKIALFDRIQDDMSTIFRQIAFFNFELEMHNLVRQKGALSSREYADLYKKHIESYIGKAMDVKPDEGYSFVYVSHFRYFFYVYSYAYGQIISKALYAKYKEDKGFINKIKEFLSAGGSKSPYQIFKDIGVDTSKPEFFEAGLKSIEEDIARLEKLS